MRKSRWLLLDDDIHAFLQHVKVVEIEETKIENGKKYIRIISQKAIQTKSENPFKTWSRMVKHNIHKDKSNATQYCAVVKK